MQVDAAPAPRGRQACRIAPAQSSMAALASARRLLWRASPASDRGTSAFATPRSRPAGCCLPLRPPASTPGCTGRPRSGRTCSSMPSKPESPWPRPWAVRRACHALSVRILRRRPARAAGHEAGARNRGSFVIEGAPRIWGWKQVRHCSILNPPRDAGSMTERSSPRARAVAKLGTVPGTSRIDRIEPIRCPFNASPALVCISLRRLVPIAQFPCQTLGNAVDCQHGARDGARWPERQQNRSSSTDGMPPGCSSTAVCLKRRKTPPIRCWSG